MTILFSEKPGTHERHEQRKHNNPLFEDGDQITTLRVEDALQQDQLALARFMETFQQLVGEIVALQPEAESQVILDLKTRLDKCMVECSALPGDLEEIRSALRKLMSPVLDAIQSSTQGEAAALAKLAEEEDARALHFALLENPLIADILKSDSLIQPTELAATLLSAKTEQLEQALILFSSEQLSVLLEDAAALLENLEKRGISIAGEQFSMIKSTVSSQQH